MKEVPLPSSAQDSIIVLKTQRVCTITMNRPQVLNALHVPIMTELQAELQKVGEDREIRVVVLQGAEGNFCSGADMSLLGEGLSPVDWMPVMNLLGLLIRTIREIPQPVICKVRGAAIGGGANLALAGDFVVAARDARFGQIFVNLGVGLDGGGTYFLPRLVGLAKARELTLLGEIISGEEAAAIGLIYRSTSDEDLDRQVDSLASRLAERPLQAMALIKANLEKSLRMTLAEVLDMETAHQSIMFQSTEHQEAVRRFLKSHGKR